MRCIACNKALNDYEATRKNAITGEYFDLCQGCFASVAEVTPLQVRDRKDLLMQEDVTQELLSIDNEAEMCYNENFRGDDEVKDT